MSVGRAIALCSACGQRVEGESVECPGCGRLYHQGCSSDCVGLGCPSSRAARLQAQAVGSPTNREPWRVTSRERIAAGYVLTKTPLSFETLMNWPGTNLWRWPLTALGVVFFLTASENTGLALFGWALVMLSILVPAVAGLRHLGRDLVVTLEEDRIRAEVGNEGAPRVVEIPRSAQPRLVARWFRPGFVIRWGGPLNFASRLVIGPLSALHREAFVIWERQSLGTMVGAQAAARIEVHATSEHRICPLCHDGVAGPVACGSCSNCLALYHEACWDEFGGCALPSCRGLGARALAQPLRIHLLRGKSTRSA